MGRGCRKVINPPLDYYAVQSTPKHPEYWSRHPKYNFRTPNTCPDIKNTRQNIQNTNPAFKTRINIRKSCMSCICIYFHTCSYVCCYVLHVCNIAMFLHVFAYFCMCCYVFAYCFNISVYLLYFRIFSYISRYSKYLQYSPFQYFLELFVLSEFRCFDCVCCSGNST